MESSTTSAVNSKPTQEKLMKSLPKTTKGSVFVWKSSYLQKMLVATCTAKTLQFDSLADSGSGLRSSMNLTCTFRWSFHWSNRLEFDSPDLEGNSKATMCGNIAPKPKLTGLALVGLSLDNKKSGPVTCLYASLENFWEFCFCSRVILLRISLPR